MNRTAAFAMVIGALSAAAGCSDGGGGTSDGSVVVDIDNGSCGDQLRFTGEYVDWDTDASFCGIREAQIEVEGGDGAQDTTAPNGRFDLCIPRTSRTTRLTVSPPAGDSQCTTPPSGYAVPALLVANRDVILAGGAFSGRAFTTARQQTFFAAVGQPFDATKAHVFVHVSGTPAEVSLAATHGAAQAVTGTMWAAGATGEDVFFPNVDVGTGTTTLSVAGGAIGTGSIPLVAGTITNISVRRP